MSSRVLSASLFLPLLFCATLRAQQFEQPLDRPMRHDNGSISGTVRSADGSTLSAVRVDLRQMPAGVIRYTASTNVNGSFAMYNIPPGQYEVVAYHDHSEVREEVNVNSMENDLELRFAAPSGSSAGDANSVSVAAMKVPEKARSAFAKAREAFAYSKFDVAQKQVTKALAIYPQFAEALTLQALLYMQKNDLLQSEKNLESAIQYDPSYAMAYLALGTVFNSLGHYDDATRTLERSVSISPNAWQNYFEMAKAYLGKGMYAKALQLANKAQSLGPSNFGPIHLLKAYAMMPQKLYRDATQELQAFLSKAPQGQSAEQAQKMLAQAQAAELASEHPGQ